MWLHSQDFLTGAHCHNGDNLSLDCISPLKEVRSLSVQANAHSSLSVGIEPLLPCLPHLIYAARSLGLACFLNRSVNMESGTLASYRR